jgi:hypothetical protein
MREQINFLIYTLLQGSVKIQVLPSGTGGQTGVTTSFSILRLRIKTLADVVYLEQIASAQFLHDLVRRQIRAQGWQRAILPTCAIRQLTARARPQEDRLRAPNTISGPYS